MKHLGDDVFTGVGYPSAGEDEKVSFAREICGIFKYVVHDAMPLSFGSAFTCIARSSLLSQCKLNEHIYNGLPRYSVIPVGLDGHK